MKPSLAVALCIALAACGGSSSSPTSPGTTQILQGQTVSAIDGSAVGAVDIQVGDRPAAHVDPNGNFQIDVDRSAVYPATITGDPIVERHTTITSTADRAKLSLIPASFDLQAFNEMFRATNSRLQRWTTTPALVVVATVMAFSSHETDSYQTTEERLTGAEVSDLVSDLRQALALLTGGTYTSFASISIERPGPGEMVKVQRDGRIVVGRYKGVSADGQTIGYGTWAENPDGTIVGGTMWLDRDFDRDDGRRRLVRIHELGHALGYGHVSVRTSIMNPAIGPEPTDFDRDGSKIAFQRPVGNVSPDTDLAGSGSFRTFDVSEGPARWRTPLR